MKKQFFTLFVAFISVSVSTTFAQVIRNNEFLNAALYYQTAGEFIALNEQAYELAKIRLDEGLADTSITAAVEQTGNFSSLPPAVILDVDETVLDNVPYQTWLIQHDALYSGDTWTQWVKLANAKPMPGAVEFCQYAASQGVTVFYVTNRDYSDDPAVDHKAPTLQNLKDAGFPVDDAGEQLLVRGEQDGWGSDKTPRREFIAQTHRIVLMVGDNANDFVSGTRAGIEERNAVIGQYKEYWGTRWITIMNDMYGGWENATYNRDYSTTYEQRLQLKYDLVDSFDALSPQGAANRLPGQNHEILHSVNWIQTAGEYQMVCTQIFEQAKWQLEKLVADTNFTAAEEQTGNFSSLPPAVVLDVDETVLENVVYEGSLIHNNTVFDSASWDVWVQEGIATAVPGAVEFCQYADSIGVTVIYVTNRSASDNQEAATLQNLSDLGFPTDDGELLLLSREQDDWGSNKTTRRAFLAPNYRIVMLVGDNVNDHVDGTRSSIAVRNEVVKANKDKWGREWIVLPNSMYGEWELRTYGRNFALTYPGILQVKYGLLNIPALGTSFVPAFEAFK